MKAPLLLAILLISQQLSAFADSATGAALSGPVLGYIFDRDAGGLRPLGGIPGAALLGGIVDAGVRLTAGAAAPGGRFVIGIDEDAQPVMLVMDSGAMARRALAGASAGVDRIALSPGATAAALFSSSGAWIEVVAGLPAEPKLSRRIDVSSLAFAPRMIAVSDDAAIVLAAGDGPSAPVWFDAAGGAHEFPLAAPSALSFRPRSHDAVFIDSAAGEISFASGIGAAAEYSVLPGFDAVPSAVAAGFSADGPRFYIANRDGTIARFGLDGAAPDTVSCGCTPEGLEPLGGSVFLLRQAAGGAPLLVDGSGETPRVLFVPPDGGDR